MGVAGRGNPDVALLVAGVGDVAESEEQPTVMRLVNVLGILGQGIVSMPAVGDEALARRVVHVVKDFVGFVAIGGRGVVISLVHVAHQRNVIAKKVGVKSLFR